MQRAEQRVIVEPPGLFTHEGTKRTGTTCVGRQFAISEVREAPAERTVLQVPDRRIVDERRPARLIQSLAHACVESAFAADLREVSTMFQCDELRIDGHRAQRGVRRRFTGGHLVDR
jgi:hypothetical protein